MTDLVDRKLLEQLKPTSARITTPYTSGSGFLTSATLVVTCFHVIAKVKPDDPVTCTFEGKEIDEVRDVAEIVATDQDADIAVLRLATPMSDVAPLPLAAEAEGAAWLSFMFPAFMAPAGLVIRGTVEDWNIRDANRKVALGLVSDKFDPNTELGGISGSPVVVDRKVVGVLYRVLGRDGERKIPHLGYCYAVPVRNFPKSIMSALGLVPIVPSVTRAQPATFDDGARARADHYMRVMTAPTASATLSALGDPRRAAEFVALAAVEQLVGHGSVDLARPVLETLPTTARQKELLALCLSLDGDHDAARALLSSVGASAERGGIEGGILKRRWLDTKEDRWRDAAYDTYLATYTAHKDGYNGINVASLALARGAKEEAIRVAREAASAVRSENREHWDWAILGEASLLIGDDAAARDYYARAREHRPARDVAVMRKQARRNLLLLGRKGDALDDVLDVGAVGAILATNEAGDDATSLVAKVRDAIERADARTGCVFPASAGEQAFALALLEGKRDLRVVLPEEPTAFLARLAAARRAEVAPLLEPPYLRVVRSPMTEAASDAEAFDAGRAAVCSLVVRLMSLLEAPSVLFVLGDGRVDDATAGAFTRVQRIE